MSSPLESGLSIVIPVYRADATLRPLADRIEQALAEFPHPFELLLVNDNSPDGSAAVIDTLAAEKPWIRGVHLMRNYGQHNAILAGIRQARFDRLVTMDDDLQHPPEAIPALLRKLDEGFDVVYAPPLKEYHGALRDVASRMTKTLLKHALGITVARDVASFRAFRTDLREAFADYHNPAVFIDVLLTWATTSFTAMPVQHETGEGGRIDIYLWKIAVARHQHGDQLQHPAATNCQPDGRGNRLVWNGLACLYSVRMALGW